MNPNEPIWVIPGTHITTNNANPNNGIEYAKYTKEYNIYLLWKLMQENL